MKLGDKELIKVYAKHDPYFDTGHAGEVIDEMKVLGPPTINVVDWRGELYAVEGSHRLFAAHFLGLIPNLIISYPERYDSTDEEFWSRLSTRLPHYAWLKD